MKKSEELLKQASEADSVWKSLKLNNLAIREARLEGFIEKWLSKFDEKYVIQKRINGSYSIVTDEHGFIDFYPKRNVVLIRRTNKWIKGAGLKWLIKNLLDVKA